MNHLLDNYIFSPSLRYEEHKLIYTPENEGPIEFGGMLAASVLCALLSVTDEGETRGIVLDTPEGRNDFFKRYEKEVIADNGGLFTTEVQMLSEAYLEFTGEEGLLLQLCRNDRILDLAVGLTVEYMERLVRERVMEHIYDVAPWTEPFAQWLFNAGYVEARRQYLLSINWTDAPAVYALAEELQKEPSWIASNQSPLFVFDDLSAEQVLNGYWNWLWETVQQEANRYPDAKKRLIEYKQLILQHETNYDDLKPEMKDFTTDQINLFRSWMNQWIDFLQTQIEPPVSTQKKDIRQELFPDNITPIPPPNDYSAVREYIHERCQYDAEFKKYQKSHYLTDLCQQLTFVFDWPVEYNSLYKSLKRRLKHPKKNHLPK
jgi:hypothetical protein